MPKKRKKRKPQTRIEVRPEIKKTYNDLIGTFDFFTLAKQKPRRRKKG